MYGTARPASACAVWLKLILPVQTADEMEAWVKRYRAAEGGEDEDIA